jgi:hypothetical protein
MPYLRTRNLAYKHWLICCKFLLYRIRSVKCITTVVTQEYVSDIECCCALLGKAQRKEYFNCIWNRHLHWQIMHRKTRAHFADMLLLSVEITSRPVMDGCEINWKCMRTEAKFISFTSWNPPRTSYVVVMYDKEYAITISERSHCHNTPRLVICFSWTEHWTNLSFNQKIRFLWQCYMSLIFPHCFFLPDSSDTIAVDPISYFFHLARSQIRGPSSTPFLPNSLQSRPCNFLKMGS